MAQLVIHRRAARYFERLDERLKAQLREKLEALARDPLTMAGVKPMAGQWRGFYRLRHGHLRLIYLFDKPGDRVVVAHIGPRHLGGPNMLFCDGHIEYGRIRKWVEHRDDVMRRWNRDHEPHPESWMMDLTKH